MTVEFPPKPITRYLGDGVQRVFPVSFPIFGDGRHVRATVSTGSLSALVEHALVYGADYTVSEVSGGGECITTQPVPNGHLLTLYLELPCVQPRDFDNLGRLDAEELEKGLDYLTALVAQNAAILARAFKIPVSSEQRPEDLLSDLFTACDASQACRDEACACAARSCECADAATQSAARAEEAREVALAQTLAVNALMAAEMAKINLVTGALRDDMGGLAQRLDRFVTGAEHDEHGDALAALARRVSDLEALVASGGAQQGNAPAAMPLASTADGVGQVVRTSNRVVPTGGTWLVFGFATTAIGDISGRFYPNLPASLYVGIHAGGTNLSSLYDTAGLVCWRIA
jgi:hypothetical protein